MTRHRYRPPAWRWWPALVLGAVPHAGLTAALIAGGDWSRVVPAELCTVAAALPVTLVLLFFRRARALAGGLLAATSLGVAAVVGVALLR